MKTYYTSDWHLFHKNVIRYSKRPFSLDAAGVEEMNQTIIKRCNERVGPDDRLYLLGDVTFSKLSEALPLLEQLRCQNIHLVPGNHDSKEVVAHVQRYRDGKQVGLWKSVSPLMDVNDERRHVVLCHYALKTWNRSHYGSYMLHGHSHGSMPGNNQCVDVGVDCWDFYPVTLDECIARMQTLPSFRSQDHHV